MFDVNEIRKDFSLINGQTLAYLDNSATSQKPQAVLDAVADFYKNDHANPFRGNYDLSVRATEAYEGAREETAKFLNADMSEIIFTRNASESLNLAAYCLGEMVLKEGDEVVVTVEEHHSNMLPWRAAAKRAGATVKYIDVDINGLITPEMVRDALTEKTKILAMTQISNIIGRENDLKTFAQICHSNGTLLVGDGAQSVPHIPVDVKDLDVDFLAFSGHKMLAPMGIGVLYGKKELLEKMPPYMTGGEMIDVVMKDRIVYKEPPYKFEAGTVNAGAAVGLAAAIRYLKAIGFEDVEKRENALAEQMLEGMKKIPYVTVIGSDKAEEHHGILTFKVEGVHPHDVSAIFAENDVAVRAGHHCAQPLHAQLGIPSTTRASLMF